MSRVAPALADALPALAVLVLTNNKIRGLQVDREERGGGGRGGKPFWIDHFFPTDPLSLPFPQDLDPLAALPKLTHLVLTDNDVARHPQYR